METTQRALEIVEKDVTNAKLTVNKDRISIKFPIGTEQEEKEELIKFFLNIVEDGEIKNYPDSLRGSLFKKTGLVIMKRNDKTSFKTFSINDKF